MLPVPKVPKETKGKQEIRVLLGRKVHKGTLGQPDLKARKVTKG